MQEARNWLLPKRTVAVILAGGRGTRLKNLTDNRAKPAVPFGGKFRIIDFTLSNCVNSGIRRIFVMTQYKAHSLLQHLQYGWSYLRSEIGEFVMALPAQQQVDERTWYRGTADAVWQNLEVLRREQPDYVIVLAGDHVYKMDYAAMLSDHVDSGADCTIGCIEVPRLDATAFGVIHIDESRRVTDFLEKPADPPGMPSNPQMALASMGIYVFNADLLFQLLAEEAADPDTAHDFGRDIIPGMLGRYDLLAHSLRDSCVYSEGQTEPYWRDVGTVDAYWASNIDLTSVTPALDLYDTAWPILTYQRQLPPAKFVFDDEERRGRALDSVVSGGCIVSGGSVRQSVLYSQVRVNSFSHLQNAVVLPDNVIGRGARLTNVVVDSHCRIPEGLVVGEDAEEDGRRFYRTNNGVVLITPTMLDALAAEDG